MAKKSKLQVGDLVRLKKPYFTNDIGLVIEVTEGNNTDFIYRIKTLNSIVVTGVVKDIEVINKA
tara:strand:+ start:279 stop:470 length:192 start_codon:yes stop_codon:yes gene_type:complete